MPTLVPRLLLAGLCTVTTAASAHPPPETDATDAPDDSLPTYETTVTDRRPRSAASSGLWRARDLTLRSLARPADLLRVAPGLMVVQHAGGGKANQYFLRGFDVDHGTDIAVDIDGVPMNLPSHGHGQGYLDLHGLIPELVERLEVDKGPYDVRNGDFATAGAMHVTTRNRLGRCGFSGPDDGDERCSRAQYSVGRYGLHRGLVLSSPTWRGGSAVLAAELQHSDGPFEHPEGYLRGIGLAKVALAPTTRTEVQIALTGTGGHWHASGQLPNRELAAGRLTRFDALDPTEGGSSQRWSVHGSVRHRFGKGDANRVDALVWLASYRFRLFSNFTFFHDDPEQGDQIEQTDSRTSLGLRSSVRVVNELGSLRFATTAGLDGRFDAVDVGLHHTASRQRLATRVDATVEESRFGVFLEEDVRLLRWLRVIAGTRLDVGVFESSGTVSGQEAAVIASPKASVIFTPYEGPSGVVDVFLNFGSGFHSNDTRAVVHGGAAFTRALGAELGVRTELFQGRLALGLAGYLVHLGDELVWSGDAGSTESEGETLRLGLELEARGRILEWLFADLDVTLNRARLVTPDIAGADAIPLAPTVTLQAGLSARHDFGALGAVTGRLGLRWIGARPAIADRSVEAEGAVVFDASIGWDHRFFELRLDLENLANTTYNEAQFATTSRLRHETCPSDGCQPDLHLTPGVPFQVKATIALKF